MTGWNLPPGCTDADIDRAFGGEDEFPDDDDCCHDDYETDSDGIRWCNGCSFHWCPTPEEIAADRHRQQEYDRWRRRQERREFWRAITYGPLIDLMRRIWPRQARRTPPDDDIPF